MRSLLMLVLAVSLVLSGCGSDEPTEGSSGAEPAPPAPPAPPAVDQTNPQEVAEEFYGAIAQGDVQAASQWVAPEQQADFLASMEGVTPQLPEDYEVVVFAQGDHAEASIAGAPIEVDMQMREGLWWISN